LKLTPQISYKLIETIGEERINAVYEVMKSRPVSFSTLKFMIRRKKIMEGLKEGKRIKEVMAENKVSKMTIYRILKSGEKSNA
jgi:hypothetical protein